MCGCFRLFANSLVLEVLLCDIIMRNFPVGVLIVGADANTNPIVEHFDQLVLSSCT
jgi:hypothetical protein